MIRSKNVSINNWLLTTDDSCIIFFCLLAFQKVYFDPYFSHFGLCIFEFDPYIYHFDLCLFVSDLYFYHIDPDFFG